VSGSPIIQDGKLVGAVPHVLANDPTRGDSIVIKNMLMQQTKEGRKISCLFSLTFISKCDIN
jgi:hypothetical protein